jgi:hypothetical protein
VVTLWHLIYYFGSRWQRGSLGFRYPGRFVAVGGIGAIIASIILFTPQSGAAPFIYFQF